jgi:hypothetical protein
MNATHVCVAATFFIVAASMAAGRTFDRGRLDIACSCVTKTSERLVWRHAFDVPKNGFAVDLDQVCATTRDNYRDAYSLCKETFRGVAYSFAPAK